MAIKTNGVLAENVDVAVLVLAAVSVIFWAFAALLVAGGVAIVDDEGWGALLALLAVAGLSAYPAFLFARAAVRVRHRGVAVPRAVLLWNVPLALGGFPVFYFVEGRSVVIAMLPVFVALVSTALRIAADYEPARRRGPRRST